MLDPDATILSRQAKYDSMFDSDPGESGKVTCKEE
jgi:hypothetical protein